MRSINKFLWFFGFFALLPYMLQAQETVSQPADTVRQGTDTTAVAYPFTYIPEELRLGLDLSRLMVWAVNPETHFVELNSDLRFGRYYLAADFGMGGLERNSDVVNYQVEGSYFRIGPDYNLIPGNEDRNTLFVGLRYGRSWYRERLNTVYVEEGWEDVPLRIDRNTSAGWAEIVLGMKARVLGNLYLGYTMRFKLGVGAGYHQNFKSYEVPGFGDTSGGRSNFSFNYHLFYRIPFAKEARLK